MDQANHQTTVPGDSLNHDSINNATATTNSVVNQNGSSNAVIATDKMKPFLELYVKASGIDHRRIGACLFCQEFWMELYALYELGLIRVEVKTVNVNSEPFKKSFLGAQPPILVEPEKQMTYTDNREIEGRIFHVAKEFRVPLFEKDAIVEKHIESLYRNFKIFLKCKTDDDKQHHQQQQQLLSNHNNNNSNNNNSNNNTSLPMSISTQQTFNKLVEQLTGIDKLLEDRGSRYLVSSVMTEYDCELMPRLHHIRIAGEQLCQVEVVPRQLTRLWAYMLTAYRTAAFIESCPADQDIIHHYKEQLNLTEKQRVSLQTPTKTHTIPDEVLDEIRRQGLDKL